MKMTHYIGALLTHLSSLSSLQEIYVWIQYPGRPGEHDSAVSGYIAPILTHLPPQRRLRAVTFGIANVGNHRRQQFLLDLSTSDVNVLLAKFPRLDSVRFWLPEWRGSGYDEARWQGLLSDRLPKLRGIVPITLRMDWCDLYVHTLCHSHHLTDSHQQSLSLLV